MAFAPGRLASVVVDGVSYTFDEWSVDFTSESADVSDFDRREARTLTGLPKAIVSMSGPYSVGNLGMFPGVEYDVSFGYTASAAITVRVLITAARFQTGVRGVCRVALTGIVNDPVGEGYLTNTTVEAL